LLLRDDNAAFINIHLARTREIIDTILCSPRDSDRAGSVVTVILLLSDPDVAKLFSIMIGALPQSHQRLVVVYRELSLGDEAELNRKESVAMI
jgi:hypothetical protein